MANKALSVLALSLLFIPWGLSSGAQRPGTSQLGLRVGVFHNNRAEMDLSTSDVKLFAHRTNFYIEGAANYYLTDFAAFALNLGVYSKGDISFDVWDELGYVGRFVGTANIYPMQAGLRLSPFSQQLPMRLQPYAEGGGALIVGRETATLGPAYSRFALYSDGTVGSEADLGWWLGGGVEIPLSRSFQLDMTVKYIDTKFAGDIAGIKDFSGWQVSVGVSTLRLQKK